MSTESLDRALLTPAAEELAATGAQQMPREVIRLRRNRVAERVLSLVSPILLLLLWELLVRIGLLDARFFPAPSSIVGTFGQLIGSGELLVDTRDTVIRTIIGLLLGGVPGLVIGATMGLSRFVRAFMKPVVAAAFPIPKIAILPLIMLIFGLGETSKYVAVAIGVVFLMLINTMAGVLEIDDIYLDVGRNFGASRWQFFRSIAVPGAMPGIFTGLQVSLTIALL
ncbi:MAG: ABC transporter permease subunit, partial [Chloroflexota bacterium]|nr:ABC transporter permease subunit [Chloroflexota bacterium]